MVETNFQHKPRKPEPPLTNYFTCKNSAAGDGSSQIEKRVQRLRFGDPRKIEEGKNYAGAKNTEGSHLESKKTKNKAFSVIDVLKVKIRPAVKILKHRVTLGIALMLILGLIAGGITALTIYSYGMKTQLTATQPPVKLRAGTDNAATINPDGTSATLNIAVIPNATAVYTDALNITGQDAQTHTITLSASTITGDLTIIQKLDLYFVKPDGTETLAIKILNGAFTQNNSGPQTLPPNANWAIKIVTVGKTGATLGATVNLSLQLTVS